MEQLPTPAMRTTTQARDVVACSTVLPKICGSALLSAKHKRSEEAFFLLVRTANKGIAVRGEDGSLCGQLGQRSSA
jgi:hypothetical protein